MAKRDMAGGAGDSQGTKGFMGHEQDFWMAVHSGELIWIFFCLKKQNRGREAGMRGKGSALIKLTVLLMSLWTQPLSFASSNFNNKMQREKERVLLLTVLLAVFR